MFRSVASSIHIFRVFAVARGDGPIACECRCGQSGGEGRHKLAATSNYSQIMRMPSLQFVYVHKSTFDRFISAAFTPALLIVAANVTATQPHGQATVKDEAQSQCV